MRIDWEGAAPHLLSENGPSRLRLLSYEVQINPVPNILHRNERSDDISPSGGPHARRSYFLLGLCHLPAVRRLALEVAHEPLTISQHQRPRLLVHGSSTVITGVHTAGLRRFVCLAPSTFLGRCWVASIYRRYTHRLAADH